MAAIATVKVDVLNARWVGEFLATVGAIAEEAPDMIAYEIQARLFRAFEELSRAVSGGEA